MSLRDATLTVGAPSRQHESVTSKHRVSLVHGPRNARDASDSNQPSQSDRGIELTKNLHSVHPFSAWESSVNFCHEHVIVRAVVVAVEIQGTNIGEANQAFLVTLTKPLQT